MENIESNTGINSIQSLFKSKKPIRIPAYQRAYSWGKKQVKQFYDDLLEQNGKNYYLGHLLFERNGNTLFIVDGQQRLTTAVIFLAALAKTLKDMDSNYSYLADTYLTDTFRTIEDDQIVLRRIIKQMSITESFGSETLSQKKIIRAFKFFSDELKEQPDKLLMLQSSLENATVLVYYIDSKVEATQIFEYQNNRGKELSPFEIIKAYLMHQIYLLSDSPEKADNDIADIQAMVSAIYRNIEMVDGYFSEYDLLNNFCYLYYNIDGNVESIKTHLSGRSQKTDWIKQFFDNFLDLTQNAKSIIIIKQSNVLLSNLFLIGNEANWKIILLVLACKGEFHSELVNNILKLLEILCFKLKLGDYRSDHLPSYAKNYFNAINGYSINNLYEEVKKATIEGFKWYWNNEGRFVSIIRDFFEMENYHYKRHIIKYVLWQYENSLRAESKSGILLDKDLYSEYTIEHIKPQKPEEGEYSDSFIERYLHKAGNLALLTQSQNSKFGNKSFSNKTDLFQDTTLISYKEIRVQKKWGISEIQERHNNMVAFIKDYFNTDNL